MKQNFIERTGDFQRKEFSIQATGQAYRILSDGLYSDKITAVLRELGTNAVDAHIMAGTQDTPWELHLPSVEQPWLKIRDYGTGLPHEDIMTLYSTYFGTNKADSLLTTGQLGLGSKSPLSYTRSFNVTSYYNGVARYYIVAVNENFAPELNYIESQTHETDEPNGLCIQIGVRTSDIREFASKASEVYKYFTHKPRVYCSKNYNVNFDVSLVTEGNYWRITKEIERPKAIMGNIAYPIDYRKVTGIEKNRLSLILLRDVDGVEIEFDNNELDFTPSRESLAYTKKTIDNLTKKIEKVCQEIVKQISNEISTAKTLWDARVKARQLVFSQNAHVGRFLRQSDIELEYRGKRISGVDVRIGEIDNVNASWIYYSDGRVKRKQISSLIPKDNMLFYLYDLSTGNYSRCEEYVRENQKQSILLVEFETQKAKQEFCDIVGVDSSMFYKASALPKPVRTVSKRNRVASNVMEFCERNVFNERLYTHWSATKVNIDDGGIFVPTSNYNVVLKSGVTQHPKSLHILINRLREVGVSIDVIGVRPSNRMKFEKHPKWTNIFDYLPTLYDKHVKGKQLEYELSMYREYIDNSHYRRKIACIKHIVNLDDLPSSHIIRDTYNIVEQLNNVRHIQKEYNVWCVLMQKYTKNKLPKPNISFSKAYNDIVNQYPLFNIVNDVTCVSEKNRKYFNHYVELLDKNRS